MLPKVISIKAQSASQLPLAVMALRKKAVENQQTLVLVTGVFDILHPEHINFLEKAKNTGDVLIVGVESDVRVRAIKGEKRPINPEVERWAALQNLRLADQVFILPDHFSDTADFRGLLQTIRPTILAVSAHTAHQDVKRALMQEIGGEVRVVHQQNPEISTTKIIREYDGQKT